MKKISVVTLIISIISIVAIITILIYFLLPSPDIVISTPTHVRQMVTQAVPKEYKLKSIESIRRISTFEGENRPMKWLVLTIGNTTITDEKDIYKIAEPICEELLSKNTGYEGIDIYPHTIVPYGANCSIWGP